MKKKSIVISGYYGFDNSGDDAILKAIVEELKSTREDIEITALSYKPESTKEIYKIKAVYRYSFKDVLAAIKDCDLFISGGGSLLQDKTSTRSLIYYLSVLKLAQFFNKKTMVFANGVGPIDKKSNRHLTKRILDKVDSITLRDNDSKKFLEELNVNNKNIIVTADPVFTLKSIDDRKVEEIFELENIPYDKPLIGISIRDWDNSEEWTKKLSKVIEDIRDKYNVYILFIPMHYPEDLEISQFIMNDINIEGVYCLNNKYSVDEIMGLVRKLDLILAMRLHSLIYAATQGTPMVGLIYDPKIIGFLDSISIDNKIYINDFTEEELLREFDIVWNNREDYKKSLIKKEVSLKNEALKNIFIALDLLD